MFVTPMEPSLDAALALMAAAAGATALDVSRCHLDDADAARLFGALGNTAATSLDLSGECAAPALVALALPPCGCRAAAVVVRIACSPMRM